MRTGVFSAVAVVAVLVAPVASADVHLTLTNGRVSLRATNATPREILLEWARVGQTKVVNADRLAGPPMSIELKEVPEAQALDTLLRSAGGYVAAPCAADRPNASHFDRIYIVAASSPARPAIDGAAAGAVGFPRSTFTPAADDGPDDRGPQFQPANPAMTRPPAGNPVFPQPQPIQPRAFDQPPAAAPPPAVTAAPPVAQPQPVPGIAQPGSGGVVGVSRPGLTVPVPQQPGQAQPPGQPQSR